MSYSVFKKIIALTCIAIISIAFVACGKSARQIPVATADAHGASGLYGSLFERGVAFSNGLWNARADASVKIGKK